MQHVFLTFFFWCISAKMSKLGLRMNNNFCGNKINAHGNLIDILLSYCKNKKFSETEFILIISKIFRNYLLNK